MGIGDGIQARAADHRGVGGIDDNRVIVAAAIQCRASRRTADDDIAIGRANGILDADISVTGAPCAGLQVDGHADRKSTRLNSSHYCASRMPSSASNNKHKKTVLTP